MRKLLFLLVAALALPAPASARDLDVREILARADVIILARVDDPPTSVTDIPVATAKGRPAVAPFQRYRRHLVQVQALRGQAPASVQVDEPGWRAQLDAYKKCRVEDRCAPVATDDYRGELAKEPVPGQLVVAFLHRNAQGELELAAERALDRGERADEVRTLLKSAKK